MKVRRREKEAKQQAAIGGTAERWKRWKQWQFLGMQLDRTQTQSQFFDMQVDHNIWLTAATVNSVLCSQVGRQV